jgi:hypothetical protein
MGFYGIVLLSFVVAATLLLSSLNSDLGYSLGTELQGFRISGYISTASEMYLAHVCLGNGCAYLNATFLPEGVYRIGDMVSSSGGYWYNFS